MTVNYILKEEVLSDLSKKIYAAQERQNDTDEQIAFYEKKLNDNKKAVTNILKAIESGVNTQTLPERLQQLENEQTVIQGELAYLKNHRTAFDEDQILFMLMQYLEPFEGESRQEYYKRIITCFVAEVYLYNDRLLIYFNISSANGSLQAEDLNKIEAGQTLSVFDQRLNWWSNPITGRTQDTAIIVLPYGFVLTAQLGDRL